jgi:hypothetical protein
MRRLLVPVSGVAEHQVLHIHCFLTNDSIK